MFDFNKLDSYKEAIDDGFHLLLKTSTGEEPEMRIGIMRIELPFLMKESYVLHVAKEGKESCITSESWEEFKIKVADYFLGGEE